MKRDELLERIKRGIETASEHRSAQLDAARNRYSDAEAEAFKFYEIRARGNETEENRLARIRADLRKHAAGTRIREIMTERALLTQDLEQMQEIVLNPETPDARILEISERLSRKEKAGV